MEHDQKDRLPFKLLLDRLARTECDPSNCDCKKVVSGDYSAPRPTLLDRVWRFLTSIERRRKTDCGACSDTRRRCFLVERGSAIQSLFRTGHASFTSKRVSAAHPAPQ
jgi:hypothetical protein